MNNQKNNVTNFDHPIFILVMLLEIPFIYKNSSPSKFESKLTSFLVLRHIKLPLTLKFAKQLAVNKGNPNYPFHKNADIIIWN